MFRDVYIVYIFLIMSEKYKILKEMCKEKFILILWIK